jgi:hypothetical protein
VRIAVSHSIVRTRSRKVPLRSPPHCRQAAGTGSARAGAGSTVDEVAGWLAPGAQASRAAMGAASTAALSKRRLTLGIDSATGDDPCIACPPTDSIDARAVGGSIRRRHHAISCRGPSCTLDSATDLSTQLSLSRPQGFVRRGRPVLSAGHARVTHASCRPPCPDFPAAHESAMLSQGPTGFSFIILPVVR